MKRIPAIGKIVLSLLLLGAVVFSFESSTSQVEAASAKAKVITKIYKGKKFLKYPQVSGGVSKSAQAKINKVLYSHIKRSYKGYTDLKKSMEEFQSDPICKQYPSSCSYEYNVSYKVQYNMSGKLSIRISDYQFSGGAHGNSAVTVYNFNLKSGKQYKLTDVVKTKAKLQKVYNYTYNYMAKRPNLFFVEELKDNLKINSKTQFYFTSGGIILVFQEYEVGPYSSGTPTVKIPSQVYK